MSFNDDIPIWFDFFVWYQLHSNIATIHIYNAVFLFPFVSSVHIVYWIFMSSYGYGITQIFNQGNLISIVYDELIFITIHFQFLGRIVVMESNNVPNAKRCIRV